MPSKWKLVTKNALSNKNMKMEVLKLILLGYGYRFVLYPCVKISNIKDYKAEMRVLFGCKNVLLWYMEIET